MEISRLPVTLNARPATVSNKASQQTVSNEAVMPVDAPNPQQRSQETFERVVQGELLDRGRGLYQSTRSFIDERSLDHARFAGQPSGMPTQARSAIFQYMNNTRPEPVSELTQGRSVNFFV